MYQLVKGGTVVLVGNRIFVCMLLGLSGVVVKYQFEMLRNLLVGLVMVMNSLLRLGRV